LPRSSPSSPSNLPNCQHRRRLNPRLYITSRQLHTRADDSVPGGVASSSTLAWAGDHIEDVLKEHITMGPIGRGHHVERDR
jgi:hypothetical protein